MPGLWNKLPKRQNAMFKSQTLSNYKPRTPTESLRFYSRVGNNMSNALPLNVFDCPHPCGLSVTSKKQAEQILSHERYLIRLERDVMAVVTDTQAKSAAAAEQLKAN